MTNTQLKTQIDTDITNKTVTNSITPTNVGHNLKDIVDYVDQQMILPYTPANDIYVLHTTGNETKVGQLAISTTNFD